jgi:DNA-binding response OmpR family regulator
MDDSAKGKTILVVEDDANLLDVLRYNMAREGYRVVTAQEGEEALAVARAEKPDLLILDIILPRLSGLDVCRMLRKARVALWQQHGCGSATAVGA